MHCELKNSRGCFFRGLNDLIRGLYTAVSGMTTEMMQNNVSANNLANVDTVGYKKDITINRSFSEMLIHRINDSAYEQKNSPISQKPYIGKLGTGVQASSLYTSFEQGSLKETDHPLDLAVDGNGFFVISPNPDAPEAERYYTRDGAFKINDEGFLCDKRGNKVLGVDGVIVIPQDSQETVISTNGEIFADGAYVGQLDVVDVGNTDQLEKIGDGLLRIKNDAQAQETMFSGNIRQGFLEASNVKSIEEMVKMITSLRSYEANQKVIQAQDETLEKAVNEVGRLG